VGGPGEAGNANNVQVAVVEELHQRPIYSVSWSPDNQIIATGGGDNQICLLKLVDGDRLEKVGGIEQAHVTDVNCVSWRPQSDNDDDNCSGDGSVVLASCSDDDIALWRVHIK
jgi:WD40 repeat protein